MWALPMLVSNWRGNREVAGDAAEYFEPGPSMETNLANKMSALLANKSKLPALSERSRERFSSQFCENGSKFRELVAGLISGVVKE